MMTALWVVLTFLLILQRNQRAYAQLPEWSYQRPEGLAQWCNISMNCCGEFQSPVDLPFRAPKHYVEPILYQHYHARPPVMQIFNNGRTVEVTIPNTDDGEEIPQPRVQGGGLNGEYIFFNMHFHWGRNDSKGSEHSISGRRYPMELHLVHYSERFPSFEAARDSGEKDAIAVIAAFIAPGRSYNRAMATVAHQLPEIPFAGQRTRLTNTFSLAKLLPSDEDGFYRYYGSLTTPTCNEVVVWTVFHRAKFVSPFEIQAFRMLFATNENEIPEERLVDNFRPSQELNGRMIRRLVTF